MAQWAKLMTCFVLHLSSLIRLHAMPYRATLWKGNKKNRKLKREMEQKTRMQTFSLLFSHPHYYIYSSFAHPFDCSGINKKKQEQIKSFDSMRSFSSVNCVIINETLRGPTIKHLQCSVFSVQSSIYLIFIVPIIYDEFIFRLDFHFISDAQNILESELRNEIA